MIQFGFRQIVTRSTNVFKSVQGGVRHSIRKSDAYKYEVRRMYCNKPTLIELVKALRKETQAGVSDCREALEASGMDLEKSKVWLMEKAKQTAKKKSTRVAADGGVFAGVKDGVGVLIELNCETDFAAKEKNFISVLHDMSKTIREKADAVRSSNNIQDILSLPHHFLVSGVQVKSIGEAEQQLTYLLKENVRLRRVKISPSTPSQGGFSHVSMYVHNVTPGSGGVGGGFGKVGKIGVLLELTAPKQPNESEMKLITALSNNLSVHIAAYKPRYIDTPTEPIVEPPKNQENGEEEEEHFNPSLMKQEYLFDIPNTVENFLKEFQKSINVPVTVSEFIRWELGEGMVKAESDLASDVQDLLNKTK